MMKMTLGLCVLTLSLYAIERAQRCRHGKQRRACKWFYLFDN